MPGGSTLVDLCTIVVHKSSRVYDINLGCAVRPHERTGMNSNYGG